MKQLWKRNAVVGTILVFVCAAIFLNGKYAEKVDKPTKVLGQSELVSTDSDAAEVSANAEGKDYFASARLTRQQARDSALSLLERLPSEDNRFMRAWSGEGVPIRNAFESQALLQLATEYCARTRCAECPVGRRIAAHTDTPK